MEFRGYFTAVRASVLTPCYVRAKSFELSFIAIYERRWGEKLHSQTKKAHPQTKPTRSSFPPSFLPPLLRVQPALTTSMKYLNSLEKHSTVWLLSCSRVLFCWSTAHKSQGRCGFTRSRICLPLWPGGRKKGVQTDGWGLLRGFCHSYSLSLAFLFLPHTFSHSRLCQKGHEAEHFGSEKSVKTCYYLIISYFN